MHVRSRFCCFFVKDHMNCENGNVYSLIATEDVMVEITEKPSKEAVVATSTRYFVADVSEKTAKKISMQSRIALTLPLATGGFSLQLVWY